MADEDKTLTCAACGVTFAYTAAEQERHRKQGFQHDPKRCPTCRKKQRRPRRRRSVAGAPPAGGAAGGTESPAGAVVVVSDSGTAVKVGVAGGSPNTDGNAAFAGPTALDGAGDGVGSSGVGARRKGRHRGGRRHRRGSRASASTAGATAVASVAAPAAPPTGDIGSAPPASCETYTVLCAECGKEDRISFLPKDDRPIYCDACYAKRRGGR